MVFGDFCRRRNFFQIVKTDDAGSASFHLLKVVSAFYISHKEQAFQRLHVSACGNHIYRNGNAGIIIVTELSQYRFRVFIGPIGYFFAKAVFFVKLFAYNLNNIVSVAVGFGKNQCFRYFKMTLLIKAVGEHLWQMLFEGSDNQTNLVWIHDVFIQLFG